MEVLELKPKVIISQQYAIEKAIQMQAILGCKLSVLDQDFEQLDYSKLYYKR